MTQIRQTSDEVNSNYMHIGVVKICQFCCTEVDNPLGVVLGKKLLFKFNLLHLRVTAPTKTKVFVAVNVALEEVSHVLIQLLCKSNIFTVLLVTENNDNLDFPTIMTL